MVERVRLAYLTLYSMALLLCGNGKKLKVRVLNGHIVPLRDVRV